MPYYSPRDSYNRYAILRWWCQNQWWIQIVVPCIICAGVIGALLYHWNNERQQQVQDQIFETQYGYMKTHPPELDPDLDEKAAAWRVIRMKKNDPSMPIPYKKKQLIVKHWKSIIVDMKAEEIQRLHDLLQDQPVKPTDDIEIDIRKFDAPWKDDVTLDDMDAELGKTVPMEEDMPDPSKAPAEGGDGQTPSENLNLPNKSADYLTPKNVTPVVGPLTLDSETEQESAKSGAEGTAAVSKVSDEKPLPNIDTTFPEDKEKKTTEKIRHMRKMANATEVEDAEPLEDHFLQQREDFIKKALEERNRKIEEFKKSQDPNQFIPTPWKRNPFVI